MKTVRNLPIFSTVTLSIFIFTAACHSAAPGPGLEAATGEASGNIGASGAGKGSGGDPGSGCRTVSKISHEDLAVVMISAGYHVDMLTYSDQSRAISWDIGGDGALVIARADGLAVAFVARGTIASDLAAVNGWNLRNGAYMSRLYDDARPELVSEMLVTGGVCGERILEFLEESREVFGRWLEEFDRPNDTPEPAPPAETGRS
ncbi:MAG: hypothetical protein LBQ12_09495 [Deltaproteobacteria bacterium]|jgi:hypothetical protein|nr:hypothetical protein [Deltaproteobacteria bacterium]